jgi:hypothetical protein
MLGGYRVLAADFDVHTAIAGAAAVTPWDIVVDARRQGLDAVAITPHNSVFAGKIGRWFAGSAGGPLVLVGEEIRGPAYHLIAVGIEQQIPWTRSASAAIDAVHRQGGIAIAAHPEATFWPAFDDAALERLDGAEIVGPLTFQDERFKVEFEQFFERRRITAIGSSDFHGLSRLGMCRTYVFTKGDSEDAILSALRAGRTIVYGDDGRAYGDLELIRLASRDGRLPQRERERYAQLHSWDGGTLAAVSRIAGVIGLLMAASLTFYRRERGER